MMERRGTYKVLVRKPEGKRPLGKPSLRRDDNIKKDLQVVEFWEMDLMELDRGKDSLRAIVNAVMNLRVP
jgi:hypothetical protein